MSNHSEQGTDLVDKEYEELRNYYDELGDRQRELRIKQDQVIVTLTVATLGFSVAFVKDIVTVENAIHEGLLIISWIVLSAGVIGTVIGITMGTLAHSYLMDRVHKTLTHWNSGDQDYAYIYEENSTGIYGDISLYFHYLSPICLGLGILFNMIFIVLNYSIVA